MTKEELPRGQLTNIILASLLNSDKYGYEIIDDIKEKTNNSIVVKQPSLYSCLRRMEEQNLISSYWRDSSIGGRRHYYSITDYGKKYADKWSLDLASYIDSVSKKEDTNSPEQNKDNNEIDTKSGTILQQSNLFDVSTKQVKNTEEITEIEQNKKTYVQFDLFTSPSVSEPSDEVFDCIKKLRKSADEEVTINKNIDELRNTTNDIKPIANEEILTSYENNSYKVNSHEQNKDNFWEFSKKQKSFAGNLKSHAVQFDDIDFNEQTTTEDIINNDTNKNEQLNTSNDDVDTNLVENSSYESPLIHSTILYNETIDDDLINNEDSVQFINLNDVDDNIPKESIDFSKQKNDVDQDNLLSNSVNDSVTKIEDNSFLSKNEEGKENIVLNNNDDAKLITEHLSNNIPKVKKIAPTRFEHLAVDNSENIIDKKLLELKQKSEYYEQEQLDDYQNETIDQSTYNQYDNKNDFNSLKSYYNSCNIKFGVYKKQQKIQQKDNTKLKTIISSITVLALVLVQSIIMYAYNSKFQPSWNWLYIVCPLIMLSIIAYNCICVFCKKENLFSKFRPFLWKWSTLLAIVILSVVVIFSFNLICGVDLEDVTTYTTTFIYLSVQVLNILIIKIIDVFIP